MVTKNGQKGIAWPEAGLVNLHLRLSTGGNDLNQGNKLAVDLLNSIAQPHAHVTDHLLVSAAACMQLASNVLANDFAKSTLISSVNLDVLH